MNTSRPSVSVVIPTYNRPGFLHHCLRCLSIQASASNPFEVIVVSDGPDPVSEKTTAAYMNMPYMPLQFLSLSNKKGPAAARNLGWKAAAGELIIFTDDDCLAGDGFVSGYAAAFQQQDQRVVAFTGKLVVPLPDTPTDYEQNTGRLATAEFVTANCACSKEALALVGGFDETFTMAWREDSDLQFKLINHQVPILRVPNAVIIHPVRPANWGISIKEQKKSMFNALLCKKHPLLFRKKIYSGPLWNYYAMNVALLALPVLLLFHCMAAATIVFFTWLVLLLLFAFRRLQHTLHTPAHIAEMIVTSAIIPLLSVYWTLYGSWRYKTLLL